MLSANVIHQLAIYVWQQKESMIRLSNVHWRIHLTRQELLTAFIMLSIDYNSLMEFVSITTDTIHRLRVVSCTCELELGYGRFSRIMDSNREHTLSSPTLIGPRT